MVLRVSAKKQQPSKITFVTTDNWDKTGLDIIVSLFHSITFTPHFLVSMLNYSGTEQNYPYLVLLLSSLAG